MRRRLILSIGANAVGKVCVLIVQLLSLAVLPRLWGAEGYGEWLMVATVPAYMAFTSLGFGDVAATEMTHQVAVGNRQKALAALQTVWAFVSGIAGTAALVAAVVALGLPTLFGVGADRPDIIITVVVMVAYAFVLIQCGLWLAAYRCTGRYAEGSAFSGLMVLIDGLVIIGAALAGGGFVVAAVACLLSRIVCYAAFYLYLQCRERWLFLGVQHFDRAALTKLRRPALAAMGMSAADALSIQGLIATIGFAASPAIAGSFAAARTLCRIAMQVSDLVGRASTPELTVAAASGNVRLFDRLTVVNVLAAAVIAGPLLLLVAIFAADFASRLSGHALVFEHWLFPVLSLGVFFQSLRIAVSQSLISVNEHHRFTYAYLAASAAMVAAPFLIPQHSHFATAVAGFAAGCELVILIFALRGLSKRRSELRPSLNSMLK